MDGWMDGWRRFWHRLDLSKCTLFFLWFHPVSLTAFQPLFFFVTVSETPHHHLLPPRRFRHPLLLRRLFATQTCHPPSISIPSPCSTSTCSGEAMHPPAVSPNGLSNSQRENAEIDRIKSMESLVKIRFTLQRTIII